MVRTLGPTLIPYSLLPIPFNKLEQAGLFQKFLYSGVD